jgi:hypothetical protein
METLLSCLLVATNVYWALVNNKLVNKLMSRNYADYQVATTITEKKNVKMNIQEESHPEDMGNLTELV